MSNITASHWDLFHVEFSVRRQSSNIFRAPSSDDSSTDYGSSDEDTDVSFSPEDASEEEEDWARRSHSEFFELEEGSDVELQEKFGLVSLYVTTM